MTGEPGGAAGPADAAEPTAPTGSGARSTTPSAESAAPSGGGADGAESLASSLAGARDGGSGRSEEAVEGDARAGDEDRARHQQELRSTRADGLDSFGLRSSAVYITGDGHKFSGSITGGDNVSGGDRNGVVVQPGSSRTVAEVTRVFVPPGGYDEIRLAYEKGSLLLLRACRGWGGTSTAIQLLSPLRHVHELLFSADLATLPVESLHEGCGFILGQLNSRQIATLRARDLTALEERFGRRRSKLVIILDADARIPDHGVDRVAQRITAPPPAIALLTSHLTERLGSAAETAALLAEYGIAERFAEGDPSSFDASRLVEFARDLAELVEGRVTFEDALARFKDRSQRDVEDWYDEIDGPDQRSIVVALAALDSMSYDAVTRAAARLEQAWRADDAGAGPPPARARRPRRARLRAARARISAEVRNTRYGRAELEVASFLDESYPERILRHVWLEHDYDRDLLIRWLDGLASDVEGRVRIRAAMAIGYLSQFAFDTIRRDIITPWAGSGDGDQRERAVAALSVPARHPDTAGRVIRMVLDWRERNGGPLCRTAARALGSSVGAVLPDGPDEHLDELAKKADPVLHVGIGDSIAELMADAEPERQIELLRLLDTWSAERRSGRQAAGVLGFLEVAATFWRLVPTPDGDVYWPALLWMASEPATADPRIAPAAPIITRLWGRALTGTDQAVHRVLRRWALTAERAPHLRPHLVRLLMAAATTERQARLLAGHARRWRDPTPLAPDLAARLLDVLSRRSHGW